MNAGHYFNITGAGVGIWYTNRYNWFMAHCGPLNELPIANHPFYYRYLLVIKPAPAKSIPIILKICKFSFIWKWVFYPILFFIETVLIRKKPFFSWYSISCILFTSLQRDIHTKVNLLKKYFLSSVNKYFFSIYLVKMI